MEENFENNNTVKQTPKKVTRKKSKKNGISVSYNAPITLTFVLICVLVMFINKNGVIVLFTAPASPGNKFCFDYKNVLDYFRLFLHSFGHTDWNHLIANSTYLLLLGPILEEKYGSKLVALMVVITTFVTGIFNACFVSTCLLGASGIVFMMILLTSYSTTIDRKKLPLSFILIFVLYIGGEILNIRANSDVGISSAAHIVGGLCGSLFGFFADPVKNKRKSS